MRGLFVAVPVVLAAGCIHGAPAPQRDPGVQRAIAQQERWAQDALARRPGRSELDAIRSNDYNAVGRGRAELKRLLQAVDRGTWIRNTTADLLAEEPDPQLLTTFDRAARLRADAIQTADEVALALADSKGGLTIGDLKPGLDAVRKAQGSEERIARLPPRAMGQKLAPVALPVPRPFLAAGARVVSANPELTRELDRLAPDDAAQIRARLADVDREREESKRNAAVAAASAGAGIGAAQAAPAAAPAPEMAPPEPREAEAPSPTLTIANDAATLMAKRTPRAITLREDGLFELAYDDAVYVVDPQGKLVRKESPSAAR